MFAEECVSKITEWSTSPGSSSLHPSFKPPTAEESAEPSATDFARQSHPGPVVLGRVSVFMLHGVASCLKALAGQTVNESPDTVHDDKDEAGFKEGTERTVDAVAMRESLGLPLRRSLRFSTPSAHAALFLSSRVVQLVQGCVVV